MGIAASLFCNPNDDENTLDRRIRPTEEQFDAQQARWNDLAEYLLSDLQERSAYPISSWLQGSYKFGTQVRPAKKEQEFDIDLGVYFRWPGQPANGIHTAVEIKGIVQSSLAAYADDAQNEAESVSPPKARCSRIHFKDSFHIDVPSYHLDANRDARRLATENDEWELSDPKAIYEWWKSKFDDAGRARARRLVRYLKMWAALNFEDAGRPSSILLTVVAAEAIPQVAGGPQGDDEWLREIVDIILIRLRSSTIVPNPAYKTENLNRLDYAASSEFITKLDDLLDAADRALGAPTTADAADIWSEVFSHFFPLPAAESVTESLTKSLATVAFEPDVGILAYGKGTAVQIRGRNSISVPRDCSIDFELLNAAQLPPNSVVKWMVRNEGEEAEATNDLGHPAGFGNKANEHSAYKGIHHMDVTVKQYGRLIGYRRIPVTVSGWFMPKRNPARPSYVKFRGRR